MPVRDVLRNKVVIAGGAGTEKSLKVSSLPFVPWARSGSHGSSSSKVVVGMVLDGGGPDESIMDNLESTVRSSVTAGPLQAIIYSPPLLEAFEEFCQRALCSEVSWSLFFI